MPCAGGFLALKKNAPLPRREATPFLSQKNESVQPLVGVGEHGGGEDEEVAQKFAGFLHAGLHAVDEPVVQKELPSVAGAEEAGIGKHDDQPDEQYGEVLPADEVLKPAKGSAQVGAGVGYAAEGKGKGRVHPAAVAYEVEEVVLLAYEHAAEEARHEPSAAVACYILMGALISDATKAKIADATPALMIALAIFVMAKGLDVYHRCVKEDKANENA